MNNCLRVAVVLSLVLFGVSVVATGAVVAQPLDEHFDTNNVSDLDTYGWEFTSSTSDWSTTNSLLVSDNTSSNKRATANHSVDRGDDTNIVIEGVSFDFGGGITSCGAPSHIGDCRAAVVGARDGSGNSDRGVDVEPVYNRGAGEYQVVFSKDGTQFARHTYDWRGETTDVVVDYNGSGGVSISAFGFSNSTSVDPGTANASVVTVSDSDDYASSTSVDRMAYDSTPSSTITGRVRECPSYDEFCENSDPGPGVGPDATVRIYDYDDRSNLVDVDATTSSGKLSFSNLSGSTDYWAEVYVGGELRKEIGVVDGAPADGRLEWPVLISGANYSYGKVVMEGPSLSNYKPKDGAEPSVTGGNVNLRSDLGDADFPSDEVEVEWFNANTDNLIDNATVTSNGTASGSWSINEPGFYSYYVTATDKYNYTDVYVSNTRTFEVTRDELAGWNLDGASASPRDREFVSTSHTHSIDVTDLDSDNVKVSFYDGDGTLLDNTTVSGSGTQTASISHSLSDAGNYQWYAIARDQQQDVAQSSNVYSYRIPGGLTIRDKDTGEEIDDREVTVDVTVEGDVYTINTNTGEIRYNNLPEIPDGSYVVDISTSGYYGQEITFFDAAREHNAYLTPEGSSPPTPQPEGDFDVTITGSNQPVSATEMASVDFDVTNTLTTRQQGTITLSVEGSIRDSVDVNLAGGETKSYTLGWQTSGDETGNLNVEVESDTDSDTLNFQVDSAPNADLDSDVNITGSNSPVQEGNTLTVDFNLTNPQSTNQTGYVLGMVDGAAIASKNVTVENNSVLEESLMWNTGYQDNGTYNFTVATMDDMDETEVTVTTSTAGVLPDDRLDVIFTLTDYTGDYTPVAETTLRVNERVNVNGNLTYQEVSSGEFGAANQYQTTLTRNQRYNLVIEHGDNTRDLGVFRTNVSGTFDLVVSQRDYTFTGDRPWTYNVTYNQSNPDAPQIEFGYTDQSNDTSQLTIDIYEYTNKTNSIYSKQVSSGPYGTYEVTQTLTSSQKDKRWVVKFCATRNGNTFCRQEVVGSSFEDVFEFIPEWLGEVISVILILLTAATFSRADARMGALAVFAVTGGLYAVGLMSAAITGVALAVAVAITFMYKTSEQPFA